MISKAVRGRMLAVLRSDWTVAVDEREFVCQAQNVLGVTADGVAGPVTLSALWRRSPPQAAEVVARAQAALLWPRVRYQMPDEKADGVGEAWLADSSAWREYSDCSDFAAHCLGLPKDQTRGRAAPLVRRPVWLGADMLPTDVIGPSLPLAEARPGDLICYAGAWDAATGKRTKVGHVEVCVERDGRKIWTVGCASNNEPSAIVRADKSAMWRRKGAVAIRPRWYTGGA